MPWSSKAGAATGTGWLRSSSSPALRKIIYTTNPIESYHRMVRNVTKPTHFSSEDAILKQVRLATANCNTNGEVKYLTGLQLEWLLINTVNWALPIIRMAIFFNSQSFL